MLHSVTDVSKENTRNWSSRPYILTFLRSSKQPQYNNLTQTRHIFIFFLALKTFIFFSFSHHSQQLHGESKGTTYETKIPKETKQWKKIYKKQSQKVMLTGTEIGEDSIRSSSSFSCSTVWCEGIGLFGRQEKGGRWYWGK